VFAIFKSLVSFYDSRQLRDLKTCNSMSIIHFSMGNKADTADEDRFIFNRKSFGHKSRRHLTWSEEGEVGGHGKLTSIERWILKQGLI